MLVIVIPIPGDLSFPASLAEVTQSAVETLGGLDILATNSGGPPPGDFESFNEDTCLKSLGINFLSHVGSIRGALPHLRKSESANVLTITSNSVKQPIPHLVLSNSIRASTVGLTKTLALELGDDGIRFNSILPGWTKTERIYKLMAHRANISGTTIENEFFI